MFTVLVTGVGAIIGYGIARSLRASRYPVRVIGMDIYEDAVGQQWCDVFEKAVLAKDSRYPEFIRSLICKHSVDLVIPGIEQDVDRMSREQQAGAFSDLPTKFVLNDSELIAIANDKWLMHAKLAASCFETIATYIDGEFADLARAHSLPLLMKPRRSYASKGISLIHDEADYRYWRQKMGDNFMVQELVGDDDNEYTVGAFGYGDATCSAPIVFQRKLSGEGSTAKARVCVVPELETLVSRLSEVFRPVGPTNFQFRCHQGKFLLLEINPRISSSSSLRTAFGVNEPEMCITYYLEQKRPETGAIRFGRAARYIEDFVSYDCPDR